MQPPRTAPPAAAVLTFFVASACGLVANTRCQDDGSRNKGAGKPEAEQKAEPSTKGDKAPARAIDGKASDGKAGDRDKDQAQEPTAVGSQQAGLPPELLMIPGGRLMVGTNAAYLLELSKQLAPYNEKVRELILRVTAAELGEDLKEVREFFLYRTPITNAQYKVFVDQTGWRFPYHWWFDARKDDVTQRLPTIREKFKGDPVKYWEAHWKELPHKIPDGDEQKPVVHVSWEDAQMFAGWAGMRLPTEEEWTFAAKGTKDPEFLFGEKWDQKLLEVLGLARMSERELKPVTPPGQSSVPTPFGIADMAGRVWEWTANEQGFQPFEKGKWFKEWEKLRRDKFGSREEVRAPDWSYNKQVCKGGAPPSAERPWELRVDARFGQTTEQTMEFLSFRVAKSTIPGRDMAKSLVRVKYDYSGFGEKREPLLSDQIGIERYELADQLIKSYQAVCLIPVNNFGEDKRLTPARLEEDSKSRPVIVGTVIASVDIAQPALKAGLYTLSYRKKGIPHELTLAVKEGMREVAMNRRAAAGGKKEAEPADAAEGKDGKDAGKSEPQGGDGKEGKDGKDGKDKKADWRTVIRRFGITEEQLVNKEFLSKLEEITLPEGNLKISLKHNLLLFSDNDGNYVAARETPIDLTTVANWPGSQLTLTEQGGKDQVTFKWAVELGARKHVPLEVELLLATSHRGAWRMPTVNATYKPNGTPSNGAPHGSPRR